MISGWRNPNSDNGLSKVGDSDAVIHIEFEMDPIPEDAAGHVFSKYKGAFFRVRVFEHDQYPSFFPVACCLCRVKLNEPTLCLPLCVVAYFLLPKVACVLCCSFSQLLELDSFFQLHGALLFFFGSVLRKTSFLQ